MTTDTFAVTARPHNTAICWADKTSIIVEYPVRDGPPYVTRLPKTTDGLIRALNLLIEHPVANTTQILRDHPKVKRVAPTISNEVKATAADIVRKMLK